MDLFYEMICEVFWRRMDSSCLYSICGFTKVVVDKNRMYVSYFFFCKNNNNRLKYMSQSAEMRPPVLDTAEIQAAFALSAFSAIWLLARKPVLELSNNDPTISYIYDGANIAVLGVATGLVITTLLKIPSTIRQQRLM